MQFPDHRPVIGHGFLQYIDLMEYTAVVLLTDPHIPDFGHEDTISATMVENFFGGVYRSDRYTRLTLGVCWFESNLLHTAWPQWPCRQFSKVTALVSTRASFSSPTNQYMNNIHLRIEAIELRHRQRRIERRQIFLQQLLLITAAVLVLLLS